MQWNQFLIAPYIGDGSPVDQTMWVDNLLLATSRPTADADADGMPDDWESAHGLLANDPSDANQDPDEDGLTNLGEYQAGTDPRDRTSNLRIQSVELREEKPIIHFEAVASKTYRLQRTSDIWAGAWVEVATHVAGSNGVAEVQDPAEATQPRRFYRLRM